MTTIAIKEKLVNYINLADKKTLQQIYSLLESNLEKQAISVGKYNEEILVAESEFKKGKFINNEDLKKQLNKW
jgi:hypothetical protein